MSWTCPYCDSNSAVMRSDVRTEFRTAEQELIIVRLGHCTQCRNDFYAIRTIKDREEDYQPIRRDELEPMTGIRINRRPFLIKRSCR